jgi:CheY-like chemotaxis protein
MISLQTSYRYWRNDMKSAARKAPSQAEKDLRSPPPLRGKRVLVVEDDAMVCIMLEDMLGELGYIIAAQAARIDGALEAVRTGEFDLAILDINIGGEAISPVAEALAARGTPFVLATGDDERGLPELYRDRPMLAKPFRIDSLERMLQSVTNSK